VSDFVNEEARANEDAESECWSVYWEMECARRVIEAVTTDDVEQAVGTRLIPLRMAHLAIEECRWDESGKRRGENVKDEGNAESLG
jgi:hypothetical protein